MTPREGGGGREGLLAAPAGLWALKVAVAATLWSYCRGRILVPFRGEAVWGGVVQGWARAILRWGGFRLRIEGVLELPMPAVLVANHQSAFDAVMLAALLPPPFVFVAKRELFRLPLVGDVLRRAGHIRVDRDEPEDRRRVVERALAHLARGESVVFFGEGTRTADPEVRPLRAGAFLAAREAGVPLVPVALAGSHRVLARGRRLPRPGSVAVSFLPPLPVDDRLAAPEGRESVRRLLVEEVARLEPETGSRFG